MSQEADKGYRAPTEADFNWGHTDDSDPSSSSDSDDMSNEEAAPPISCGEKRTRGPNTCRNISTKKLKINFNRNGVPYGPMAKDYGNHVNLLAKQRVPITLASWAKLDKEDRDKLWAEIKV